MPASPRSTRTRLAPASTSAISRSSAAHSSRRPTNSSTARLLKSLLGSLHHAVVAWPGPGEAVVSCRETPRSVRENRGPYPERTVVSRPRAIGDCRQCLAQLTAGADAELGEYLAQVPFD